MHATSRLLTTAAASTKPTAAKVVGSRLRKPPPPSLDHFIQRQRAIGLYRTIVRNLYRIPRADKDKRNAMIAHARGEFERNKHVSDITQIRYLISTGKTDFQGMERYIDELASR